MALRPIDLMRERVKQVARMSEAKSGADLAMWHPACRFAHAGYGSSVRLAKVRAALIDIPGPIDRQQSLPHILMERRIWPIANARDEAMLHRVEMHVVSVPGKVGIVADGVFPISSLPQREFAVGVALEGRAGREQAGAEMSLDPPPTTGKIGIARR